MTAIFTVAAIGGSMLLGLSCANILTQQADVQTEMVALKKTLAGIYDQDVKPNL